MSHDLETRAGLDPLARLHAKRDELVQRSASLYARFGAYGTAEARRKSALALAAMQVRQAVEGKITEKAIDDAAHVHPTYLAYLDEMEEGRATWLVLENQTQNVTDEIARGPALARFAAAELSLTPRGV
jgi:hypothetical protein